MRDWTEEAADEEGRSLRELPSEPGKVGEHGIGDQEQGWRKRKDKNLSGTL